MRKGLTAIVGRNTYVGGDLGRRGSLCVMVVYTWQDQYYELEGLVSIIVESFLV
jgi:hypothetical protein